MIPDFKKHKFRPEDRTSLTLQYHGLCNAGTVLTRRIENSSRELKQSANDMQRLREENLRLKRRLTTHEQRSRLPAKSDSRISLPRSRPSTTALESTRPSKKPKYESSSYFQESQTPSSQAQATFLHPMKPRTAQSTLDKLSSCAPQSAPRSDSPDQHSTSFPSATPVSATRILRRGPELSSRDLMPPPPLPYSSPPPRRQPFRYPQVDRTLKRPLSSSQSPQALFVPLDRSTLSPSISFHQPPAVMTPHFTQQRQRLGPVPLTHISRQGVTAQPEYDMREYASQWEAASSEIDVPRGLRHRIDTSPTSSPSDDPRAHMHLSDSEQSMAATAAPDEGVDDRIVGYLEPFNRAPSTSNERKRLFRSLS